jgi:hypothetical protein
MQKFVRLSADVVEKVREPIFAKGNELINLVTPPVHVRPTQCRHDVVLGGGRRRCLLGQLK